MQSVCADHEIERSRGACFERDVYRARPLTEDRNSVSENRLGLGADRVEDNGCEIAALDRQEPVAEGSSDWSAAERASDRSVGTYELNAVVQVAPGLELRQ